jgi:hypothetical protein
MLTVAVVPPLSNTNFHACAGLFLISLFYFIFVTLSCFNYYCFIISQI